MAVASAALVVALAACGSTSSSGGTPPSTTLTCSNVPAGSILILNNAVCPQALTVSRGAQVTFINNDAPRAHEMYSDPHPEHTDCPEINQVGHLEPGQQRQTGNLNIARRCGFHDHLNDTNAALRGAITIQ